MGKDKLPSKLKNVEGIQRLNNCLHFVYFLCNNDEVVYVGQTKYLRTRIFFHKKDKQFKNIYYIKLPSKAKALSAESYYISKFDPKYNKTNNEKPKGGSALILNRYVAKQNLSSKEVSDLCGIPIDTVRAHKYCQRKLDSDSIEKYGKGLGIAFD
jgi:predicted GIY-YIG superfamily endonuclease